MFTIVDGAICMKFYGKTRFLGICGRKIEAVWASSLHKKDAEATLRKLAKKRSRKTCGRERVKSAGDFTL